MMMLVIKGDVAAAQFAAAERGVAISVVRYRQEWQNVYAECGNSGRAAVVAWFAEPSYEPGALLFYTEATS